MKQKALLNVIAIFLFLSCDKNNDVAFQLSGTYATDLNENIEQVILLTHNKKITDTATVLSFLKRRNLDRNFIFGKTSVEISTDLLTINFQDSLVNYLVNDSIHKSAKVVSKSASLIIISDIDSLQTFVPINYSRCEILSDSIKEINPVYVFYPLPGTSGFDGYNKFTLTFPLIVKNQQLLLPLITYVTSSSNGTAQYCDYYTRDLWNEFNPNIVNQLNPEDTIVYQIKQVPLTKK